METLIIIISIILFVVSIVGCFNPIFPGPPIAYLSIIILHFFTSYSFEINILILLTFFLIFITAFDYWMQIKGVKYFGGGKYAERGVLFGIIFGLFFFSDWNYNRTAFRKFHRSKTRKKMIL